ncbi:MAG: ABC transporter permease, partial [Chloroflexi bacterium]|nr:ABC transporter permease [Chloroflexota bacterium]
MSFVRFSLYATLLLMAGSWGFLLLGGDSNLGDLFQSQTWSHAGSFLGQLLGLGSDRPPIYLQGSEWAEKFRLAYRTLAMSVLAIGIAGAGAMLTLLPGARNVSNGELGGRPSRFGSLVYYLVRLIYTFTRAVPELVWALIVVFFFSGGVLAGAIALGVHNFGGV